MALQNYVAKAAAMMAPLPEGLEVYRVTKKYVYPDAPSRPVCWECGKWIAPEEELRSIVLRKVGSSYAGRKTRFVHDSCFRGNRRRSP